ncbi:MAG TPA: putative peptidoglycan glycosyltransferase FtsW, partial [Bacteroidia bacterium]|nr:putative peptidoglycan glycosyltransferase FtsW [Bacteroidia bacterium]
CVFSAHVPEVDGYREAKRQAVSLVLGIGVLWGAALVDYRFWKRHVWTIFAVVAVFLALCYVPGIGLEVNGEQRWIGAGPVRIQPSEMAKIALVVFLAYWFSRYPDCGRDPVRGFLLPLALSGILLSLVLFEVDIGTTAVLSGTTLLVLFVAGVDWKYLSSLVLAAVIGFLGMLSYAPNRMERIMAFLDPEEHRLGAGFQQWISLMAIGSGGMTGRGVGEGRLKMLYMPFAQTDFIFPMVGEEMGLVTMLLVVVAFITIAVCGFVIAFHAPDRFGSLLAIGLVAYVCLQAFINIGVVTSILPNKGITLPYVSYGGSSLVIGLFAVGILVNIFRQGRDREAAGADWVRRQRITPRV